MMQAKNLVLVSWNGQQPALSHLLLDATPAFDVLIFNYSGNENTHQTLPFPCQTLSQATECKGDIYRALAKYLQESSESYYYIGILDDDIIISISDINKALHIAHIAKADVFSPALTHDSYYAHHFMLQRPSTMVREVDWVEVMMPFYRSPVFMAASAHFDDFVSSWGFDCYLFPMVQKVLGMEHCMMIDAVAATHYRPVSSQLKKFKNGMNAAEEKSAMREYCKTYISQHHSAWLQEEWYDRLYLRKHPYTRVRKHLRQIGRLFNGWLRDSI